MTRTREFLRSLAWSSRAWLAVSSALVVLAGAAAALAVTIEDVTQHNGLSTSDAPHLRFFVDHRGDRLVTAAKVVTQAGAAPVLALLGVVVAVGLWWRGARVIVAVAPTIALGAGAVAASVVKQLIGRARPPISVRLVNETEASFPSGHATDSAAFYITLALVLAVFVFRRPLARVVTTAAGFAIAGCIGLSRLVLGVHWPTDVLAGWALGTTTSVLVVLVVSGLNRVEPRSSEGAQLRVRLMMLLHARRSYGLRAV